MKNDSRLIAAARELQKDIVRFNAQANKLPKPFQIRIGIHSGELISGNIGSSTIRRLDYTVIGDVVNTAQRLQSTAKAGQIIINETSYEKVKESFSCVAIGEATLKNKAKPMTLYEVVD